MKSCPHCHWQFPDDPSPTDPSSVVTLLGDLIERVETDAWRSATWLVPGMREALRLANSMSDSVSELKSLRARVNTPEVVDFAKAVQLEAVHQRDRWGSDHDAGKTDADWFWLIGYLAGKALHNPGEDPRGEKRLHRIITVAAAAANWHSATLGKTNMRPGTVQADS